MNCIIIDDESMARAIIEQMCFNNKNVNLIESFSNAMEAIKYLNQNEIDLIFLDIHMPGFTGFDLLQTIKNPPKVILSTSDSSMAIEAFEYSCIVDYLLKPVTQQRFDKAVQKAVSFTKKEKQTTPTQVKDEGESITELYVNIDRRLVKINFETINIVEARGDYILIRTEDKNYTVHSTLKKIFDKLPNDLFLKVHRSYIINTKKIIDIEDNSVLIDSNVVPVSRSNRPELMRRLNLL
ncbi:two component transcriptional regulator, LytTR family [Lutibacter oricola]|uniref:Two component transcriptional regulator, LytTR family n=1 Tax=Lutibacter oricola TaxID=762486 RepID=A0A1H3AG28_9FLAO|nr:LytTR family DNA-binding domain-containing protein [Lutibacter oricola]SDX28687.1 two component transcriptional regulator, LytTR family [Lutibacter oricola]